MRTGARAHLDGHTHMRTCALGRTCATRAHWHHGRPATRARASELVDEHGEVGQCKLVRKVGVPCHAAKDYPTLPYNTTIGRDCTNPPLLDYKGLPHPVYMRMARALSRGEGTFAEAL